MRPATRKLLGTAAILFVLTAGGVAGVPAGLYAQSYDDGSYGGSEVGATEERFQNMESEIRRLTGQVEEQSFQIQQLREEIERLRGEMDVRLRDVAGGVSGGGAGSMPPSGGTTGYSPQGGMSGGSTSVGGTTPPYAGYDTEADMQQQPPSAPSGMVDNEPVDASTPVQDDPTDFVYSSTQGQLGTINQSQSGGGSAPSTNSDSAAYDYAFSYVKARNFDQAEREFESFMQKYPDSSMIPNAKYWYAETFYVRGNYDKSARLFAEGYKKDPKGSKAASNLLKLGMSLAGLGKKDDACIAFKQLQKDYAGSSVPVLNRGKTEMERVGCQ